MDCSFETRNKVELMSNRQQIIRHPLYNPLNTLSLAWFDLKVFYVRFSNLMVDDETPEFLRINHIPLGPDTLLEVNGLRCGLCSDGVTTTLKRDRMDKKCEEATFVGTDSIQITGSVKFEVFHKDSLTLFGVLDMSSAEGFVGDSKKSYKRWSMDCESQMMAGQGFLRGRQVRGQEIVSPTIEVYVAGCFSGTPIVITKAFQLSHQSKHDRKTMLDAIPENETMEEHKNAASVMYYQARAPVQCMFVCMGSNQLDILPKHPLKCPFEEILARVQRPLQLARGFRFLSLEKMERFSSRESVHVGYRHSPSRSSSSSFSEALVDFHDVFGGPPRRVSIQDGRYSFNNDSVEDGVVGMVETRRNPWGGLGISEKPVFGEATSRRKTSDDFFDDIFRVGGGTSGDLYASSVPADAGFISRNDAFSVAPQSSVSSKFGNGMEVPVFASVSRSPRRSGDNYPRSPTLPSSRLSRPGSQHKGDISNDAQVLYRQSPLSVEFSFANDGSIKVTKSDNGENIVKLNSTVSDNSLDNSNHFHFSIYNWASKGAPTMMPIRGGVNFRLRDRSFSKYFNDDGKFEVDGETEKVAVNLEDEGIASTRNFELKESKTPRTNLKEKDEEITKSMREAVLNKGLKPRVEERKFTRLVTDSLKNSENIGKDISYDFSYYEIRARSKSRTVADLINNDIKKDETTGMDKENQKSDQATAMHENEAQADNLTYSEAAAKPKGTIFSRFASFGSYMKKPDGKSAILDTNSDVDKTSVPSSPGEGGKRRKVKEKVKEFVEMFNQDSSSKPKMDADMADKKIKQETISPKKKIFPITSASVVKDTLSQKAKKAASHTTDSVVDINIESSASPIEDQKKETFESATVEKNVKTAAKVKLDSAQLKKSSSRSGILTDTNLAFQVSPLIEREKEAYKNDSQVEGKKSHPSNSYKFDKQEKEDSCREPGTSVRKDTLSKKKDVSSPGTGSLPDLYQDANESLFDPIDAFEIKELTEELSNVSQMDEYQLALQESDANIRLWSRGKEGNIRSLLTTLQNVLWPGSGWKPVALMDIIEANQVKRTYQRALLCLHPDKLQQKGAAEHQKYIAGKVFDILQESWNHFNTLTSM